MVNMKMHAQGAGALEREERHRSLLEFLDHMDEVHGAPSEQDMSRIDKKIADMWARHEAYLSRPSS